MSLLPAMVHIRGIERLSVLVRLVGEEASTRQAGRHLVLTRLVEVLLIEALRASKGKDAPPGLLRGLAASRVAVALRQVHEAPHRSWTVADLADKANMSRSAFFDRFTRAVGLRPMEYLLAWRMAVAKDILRGGGVGLDEVARRVGYGSRVLSVWRSAGTWGRRLVGIPERRFLSDRECERVNAYFSYRCRYRQCTDFESACESS